MHKIFRREVACIIIPELDFISITTNNSPGFVEFDFFRVWEFYKENKEKIDLLCLLHTHPPGFNRKSSTDENMVIGWYKAFTPVKINYSIIQLDREIIYLANRPNDPIEINEDDILAPILNFLSYREQNPTAEELKLMEELCQTAIHTGL